jgi:cation diffusion facilitator CzcD-associated flavoprotein CzcO
VVIERADDVGGTWRDNTYPGCTCDVPSNLYSFSFAPNPDWSCTYPPQQEILRYLRRCADQFDVRRHIHFRTALISARWDAGDGRWSIETTAGRFRARFLLVATGGLSDPRMPEIRGIESFRGTLFHSADWRHDHDLRGERVAVIGTGASAIQFIPKVQPLSSRLTVFQRTPAWVLPHPNRRLLRAERWLSRRAPASQTVRRLGIYINRELMVLGFAVDPRFNGILEMAGRQHLRRQVRDPVLRRKLTPRYRLGCKRILISNDFYPSLTRPNVEVVTDPITEAREHSLVTADGTERVVDTIIAGTGFHVSDPPAARAITGSERRTLAQVWDGSPKAYLGTTIAGFPNLFWMFGPNTALGHTSVLLMIESQIAYVLGALETARRQQLSVVEVRPEAQAAYTEEMRRRSEGTVWTSGGCSSYYLDARGRNFALWPSFTFFFRGRTRRFDPAAYRLERVAHEVAA